MAGQPPDLIARGQVVQVDDRPGGDRQLLSVRLDRQGRNGRGQDEIVARLAGRRIPEADGAVVLVQAGERFAVGAEGRGEREAVAGAEGAGGGESLAVRGGGEEQQDDET